jgi:hypothetical protein
MGWHKFTNKQPAVTSTSIRRPNIQQAKKGDSRLNNMQALAGVTAAKDEAP